jgi:hypothetical protein
MFCNQPLQGIGAPFVDRLSAGIGDHVAQRGASHLSALSETADMGARAKLDILRRSDLSPLLRGPV